VARLSLAGMTFWTEVITESAGARLIYGRDPDGNVIELHQRTLD